MFSYKSSLLPLAPTGGSGRLQKLSRHPNPGLFSQAVPTASPDCGARCFLGGLDDSSNVVYSLISMDYHTQTYEAIPLNIFTDHLNSLTQHIHVCADTCKPNYHIHIFTQWRLTLITCPPLFLTKHALPYFWQTCPSLFWQTGKQTLTWHFTMGTWDTVQTTRHPCFFLPTLTWPVGTSRCKPLPLDTTGVQAERHTPAPNFCPAQLKACMYFADSANQGLEHEQLVWQSNQRLRTYIKNFRMPENIR